jgi:hypothetical protein
MLADANVLLVLAIILVAGTLFGVLAKLLHLPSVTGQILRSLMPVWKLATKLSGRWESVARA